MSIVLLNQLKLEHWCEVSRAHALAKELYWYWQVFASNQPSADHTEVAMTMCLDARINDAFAFTPERPRDVIAAFEAMLLAGEVARAYEYIRGPEHSFTSFTVIRCDHTPDFMQAARGVVLAKHAVRIAEAIIDAGNSIVVGYEKRVGDQRAGEGEMIHVKGSLELLQDLGLVT